VHGAEEDPAAVAAKAAAFYEGIKTHLVATIKAAGANKPADDLTIAYVSTMIVSMYESANFDKAEWIKATVPYLAPFAGEEKAKGLIKPLTDHYIALDKLRQKENNVVEEYEGEELCNCEFSLAYGGMILLNNTKLRLHRGQRYGLCGPNGVGKTTLMRAIANGQLDGFPPADVLKTVFVEHNLQASEAELSVLEFCTLDPKFVREEVMSTLSSVGFTQAMQDQAVGSLSGGWKMKLELARAMLENADILLLDEPTNHLDVANVKWLVDYLTSLTNVTRYGRCCLAAWPLALGAAASSSARCPLFLSHTYTPAHTPTA
jgi:elongation factor 3